MFDDFLAQRAQDRGEADSVVGNLAELLDRA
jgi:hypothetical protein